MHNWLLLCKITLQINIYIYIHTYTASDFSCIQGSLRLAPNYTLYIQAGGLLHSLPAAPNSQILSYTYLQTAMLDSIICTYLQTAMLPKARWSWSYHHYIAASVLSSVWAIYPETCQHRKIITQCYLDHKRRQGCDLAALAYGIIAHTNIYSEGFFG